MVTYEFRLVCENVYVPYNLFVLKCLKNQPNQTIYTCILIYLQILFTD